MSGLIFEDLSNNRWSGGTKHTQKKRTPQYYSSCRLPCPCWDLPTFWIIFLPFLTLGKDHVTRTALSYVSCYNLGYLWPAGSHQTLLSCCVPCSAIWFPFSFFHHPGALKFLWHDVLDPRDCFSLPGCFLLVATCIGALDEFVQTWLSMEFSLLFPKLLSFSYLIAIVFPREKVSPFSSSCRPQMLKFKLQNEIDVSPRLPPQLCHPPFLHADHDFPGAIDSSTLV